MNKFGKAAISLLAILALNSDCASAKNTAYAQTIMPAKSFSSEERILFDKFMKTTGKKVAEEYRQSILYPSGCTDISKVIAALALKEGIKMRAVEGRHIGDFYDGKSVQYHAFNIVNIDGKEYVLDFTANQFTKPVCDVEENGVHRVAVEDESKGTDAIPYLKKLLDAKEYEVVGDISDTADSHLHPDARTILLNNSTNHCFNEGG